MGVRINAFFAHALCDWADHTEILRRLMTTTDQDQAIEGYWKSIGDRQLTHYDSWVAEPPDSPAERRDLCRYTSPFRNLFVTVTPTAVRVHTAGRWRAFVEIAPLRDVHRQALCAMARAFAAQELWYLPDDDLVNDVFLDGGTVEQCVQSRTDRIGPPQLWSVATESVAIQQSGIWFHEWLEYRNESKLRAG